MLVREYKSKEFFFFFFFNLFLWEQIKGCGGVSFQELGDGLLSNSFKRFGQSEQNMGKTAVNGIPVRLGMH